MIRPISSVEKYLHTTLIKHIQQFEYDVDYVVYYPISDVLEEFLTVVRERIYDTVSPFSE